MRIGKSIHIRHFWLLCLPWLSVCFGLFLNAVVLAANHSQMPVHVWAGDCSAIPDGDTIHACMTTGSHLKVLSDWFVLPENGIYSPGDFFIWLWDISWVPFGIAWFVLHCISRDETL